MSSSKPLLGRSESYQIPNAVREAMLQAGCGNALVILEGVYLLGCYDNVWMTHKQLFSLLNSNFGQSVRRLFFWWKVALSMGKSFKNGLQSCVSINVADGLINIVYPTRMN